ncbi:MAG: hypothetical protein KAQ94_09165 [Arcobacteraceae bacterium]|nr:hypothetical protein [Arcobacteraceae bacterium]
MTDHNIDESIIKKAIIAKLLLDLQADWSSFKAFELNLINNTGRRTKNKITTKDEKDAYDSYYRIIFNLKRMLQKTLKYRFLQKFLLVGLLKEDIEIEDEISKPKKMKTFRDAVYKNIL